MATTPTVVPAISPAQFAARIAQLFPQTWASPDAAQGGNLHALLVACGSALNRLLAQIQYARSATLIPTETSPELDLASLDFFGGALPRPPGMDDANFSNLILSSIFQSAATRAALSNALTNLTGIQPRMIEPWSPGDTGALDAVNGMGKAVCFLDVDTRANPMRASGEEQFTGFIETAPAPGVAPLAGNPVPTLDDALWIDIAGSFVGDLQASGPADLFALVNRLRAYGITVGIKIVTHPT